MQSGHGATRESKKKHTPRSRSILNDGRTKTANSADGMRKPEWTELITKAGASRGMLKSGHQHKARDRKRDSPDVMSVQHLSLSYAIAAGLQTCLCEPVEHNPWCVEAVDYLDFKDALARWPCLAVRGCAGGGVGVGAHGLESPPGSYANMAITQSASMGGTWDHLDADRRGVQRIESAHDPAEVRIAALREEKTAAERNADKLAARLESLEHDYNTLQAQRKHSTQQHKLEIDSLSSRVKDHELRHAQELRLARETEEKLEQRLRIAERQGERLAKELRDLSGAAEAVGEQLVDSAARLAASEARLGRVMEAVEASEGMVALEMEREGRVEGWFEKTIEGHLRAEERRNELWGEADALLRVVMRVEGRLMA